MTAVLIGQTASILKNLNADLSVTTTASSEAVDQTCGTYALINQIISDLASLRSTLKTAEKGIEAAIRTELEMSATQCRTTNTMIIQTTNIPSTCAVATKTSTTSATHLDSTNAAALLAARNEDTTLNQNIGIKLGSSSVPTTESAILNGLAEVYGLVNKIKNGQQIVATAAVNTA